MFGLNVKTASLWGLLVTSVVAGGPIDHAFRRDVETETCSVLDEPLEFTSYMFLELSGRPGLVEDEDLLALETAIVASFISTGTTCEGTGLQIVEEAQILPDAIDAFGDNLGDEREVYSNLRNFTYLAEIRGTCNVCLDGTADLFYNDETDTMVSDSMTMEPTDEEMRNCTCQGPNEDDFVVAINDAFSASTAGSIEQILDVSQARLVEECLNGNATEFNSTFLLPVSADFLSATLEEQQLFAQSFLESYNQGNVLNDEICDPFFRVITEVRLILDFSISEQRRLDEEVSIQVPPQEADHHGRDLQFTFPPTGAPTSFIPPVAFVDVQFLITGQCTGCESGQSIFDQVISFGGLFRQLKHKTTTTSSDDEEYPSLTDCLCADDADQRGPNSTDIFTIFEDVVEDLPFVSAIGEPVELRTVDCVDEVDYFETQVALVLTVAGEDGLTGEIRQSLDETFVCSYNELAELLCDPYFRSITSATSFDEVRDGANTIVYFAVEGRCRGCQSLFDDDSDRYFRRKLGGEGIDRFESDTDCVCRVDSIGDRAPSDEEFGSLFAEKIESSGVTVPTDPPSISPTYSQAPSEAPSNEPTTSSKPSALPTPGPSVAVTISPAPTGSSMPTGLTLEPSSMPSSTPSVEPSSNPTFDGCPMLQNVVPFVAYVLVDLEGIPGNVTLEGIRLLEDEFIASYNDLVDCGNGPAVLNITKATIEPQAVDAYGDNLMDDSDVYFSLRNFTYLMVVHGICNDCMNGEVDLFANETNPFDSRLLQVPRIDTPSTETKGKFTHKVSPAKSEPSALLPSRGGHRRRNKGGSGSGGRYTSKTKGTKGQSRRTPAAPSHVRNGKKYHSTTSLEDDDARAIIAQGSLVHGSRKLEEVSDPTCECEVPSEMEMVGLYNENYFEGVEGVPVPGAFRSSKGGKGKGNREDPVLIFEREGIRQIIDVTQIDFVDNCTTADAAAFNATIVVRVTADILNATEEELFLFRQAFIESYNQASALNDDICDPFFRVIDSVDIEFGFEFNRRRQLQATSPAGDGSEEEEATPMESTPSDNTHDDGRHLAGQRFTLNPTSAPTAFVPEVVYVDLLFTLTGQCIGCTVEQNVFDQILLGSFRGREMMAEPSYDFPYLSSQNTTTCLCPDDVELRGPSSEEVLRLFSERVDNDLDFVQDVQVLIEVDTTDCPEQVEFFETAEMVVVELNQFVDLNDKGAVATLEDAFVCSYNELAERHCDPEFRTVISATCIEEVSFQSVYAFTFAVYGRCRGCVAIFDEDSLFSRTLGEGTGVTSDRFTTDDVCYCDVNGPDRAPTTEEFEQALQEKLNVVLTAIPSSNPTDHPTAHPTKEPTYHPTKEPTYHPTKEPTEHPTYMPPYVPYPTYMPPYVPTPTYMPPYIPTGTLIPVTPPPFSTPPPFPMGS